MTGFPAGRTARMAWLAIAFLCTLGVAAAIIRGADTIAILVSGAPPGELGPIDRANFEGLSEQLHAAPGSPERHNLEAEYREGARKYSTYPGVALMHVIPGALILAFAPLQFSRRIRTRHPGIHRATGRALLVLAVAAGLSGLFFGLLMPYGGAIEASAIALFGAFFLFAAARAYLAIRRRDVARHREWMIRMFAAALAVAFMRLIAFAFVAIAGVQGLSRDAAGFTMWAGWLITLAAAELWIRRSRGPATAAQLPEARMT